MKVLILKPSSLGDVIHALPVLRLLKKHRPDARVTWWISSALAPLLEADPDLEDLLPFDRRRWGRPRHWPELAASVLQTRARRYDVVIDLQALARSALFGWLANAGLTIGLEDSREGAHAFYDHPIRRPSPLTHAVDWYLQTLAPLGIPRTGAFDWIPLRKDVRDRVRQTWNVEGGPWVLLIPGARWFNKRWPSERFADLVRALCRRSPGFRFAVLGGGEDRAMGQAIHAAAPDRVMDLTGRTTLPEMVEWIRLGHVMVTNDTGPMHVAAALGKPVVALFGPTELRRTGPYGQLQHVLRHDLPCAPCLKDSCAWVRPMECLERISVDETVAQVLGRLSP